MDQHLYLPQDFKEMEMEESHVQPGFTSQTEEGVSIACIYSRARTNVDFNI